MYDGQNYRPDAQDLLRSPSAALKEKELVRRVLLGKFELATFFHVDMPIPSDSALDLVDSSILR